jgi:BMFP domain-containing protein YqiC
MSKRKEVLARFGKLGSDALISAVNLKREIETQSLDRFERLAKRLKLVRREEFDSLQSSLKQARVIQEKLEARVKELESQVANRGKSKTIHNLPTDFPAKATRRAKQKN